jgi:hypothetical protein
MEYKKQLSEMVETVAANVWKHYMQTGGLGSWYLFYAKPPALGEWGQLHVGFDAPAGYELADPSAIPPRNQGQIFNWIMERVRRLPILPAY